MVTQNENVPTSRKSTVCLVLALLGGSLLFSTPCAAQAVYGRVVDSVSRNPVAGAVVSLLDSVDSEIQRAHTDPDGRFLLAPPWVGTYRLRVERDEYEALTFPAFQAAEGTAERFLLLLTRQPVPETPLTAADVIARVCPQGVPSGRPVVFGMVRDGETGAAVPDAVVHVSTPPVPDWLTAIVGDSSVGDDVDVASDGLYALCGVSVDVRIAIHATADSLISYFATFVFVDSGVHVGPRFEPLATPLWRQDLELRPANGWTASVTGVVRDSGGLAMPNVEARVPLTEYVTRTDTLGRYRLAGIPHGTTVLEFRAIGYRRGELQVVLDPDRTVEVPEGAFAMSPVPVQLEPVVVTGESPGMSRRLRDFERRRAHGSGTFLTREDLERKGGNPQKPTDVISRIPGFRVMTNLNYGGLHPRLGIDTRRYVIEARRRGNCSPIVFLDGIYIGSTDSFDMDNLFNLAEFGAIEAYSGASSVPAELNRTGSACGVLAIWTR
jgi:hypothetical protein